MIPNLHYLPLQPRAGKQRVLLRLSSVRKKLTVAIVLDMSDSCEGISEIASRLPALFSHLPRNCPLLIYRLSSPIALNRGSQNDLGHFVDGSISLMKWLNDRKLVQSAAGQSSFLGPVLNAIIADEEVNSHQEPVLVVVVTDGELLDRDCLKVPNQVEIIGLAPSFDRRKTRHWRRVLESRPICDWNDPNLSPETLVSLTQFTGLMEIEIVSPLKASDAVQIWEPNEQTLLSSSGRTHWSSQNESLIFVVNSESDIEKIRVNIRCEGKPLATLLLAGDGLLCKDVDFDLSVLQVLNAQFSQQSTVLAELRSKTLSAGGEIATIFSEIQRLAMAREPWSRNSEAFKKILEPLGSTAFEGAICFTNVLNQCESDPLDDGIGLIVFAVSKSSPASLRWSIGTATVCGVADQSLDLRYDRFESRWILKVDSEKPILVSPRGSQLCDVRLTFNGKPWACYFSGSLEQT